MENNQKDKKPSEGRHSSMKKAMNRYGIAVALLACAAIVAGTWLFTDGSFKPGTTKNPSATSSSQYSNSDVSQQMQDVLTRTSAPTAAPTATTSVISNPNRAATVPDLVKPAKGDVSKPFAYDTLVYMKTLNQWQTHLGVDIAAKAGDDVVAALDGTIDSAYSDPMLGNCIKIASANNITTIYAGLVKIDSVKKGDAVVAGEVIGQIGNTASSEITEDSHLHFEVWQGDTPVNPASYFKKS